MKVDIYNQEGEKIGEMELPKKIFDVEFNPDLVHQVVVSQMANKRTPIAHTKDRGEVRGGGKKPWPQKGLGRARHGSIRSPIFKGGGVVFGPRKYKKFEKKIPKKIKRKALFMILSEKLRRNLLFLFEEIKVEKPKTKIFAQLIEKWKEKIKNFKKGSILIALGRKDENLSLAARNIPNLKVMQAKDLNCLDLLSFKYLVLTKDSVKVIEEQFKK
jgi:large subunit ribosomal protein L4